MCLLQCDLNVERGISLYFNEDLDHKCVLNNLIANNAGINSSNRNNNTTRGNDYYYGANITNGVSHNGRHRSGNVSVFNGVSNRYNNNNGNNGNNSNNTARYDGVTDSFFAEIHDCQDGKVYVNTQNITMANKVDQIQNENGHGNDKKNTNDSNSNSQILVNRNENSPRPQANQKMLQMVMFLIKLLKKKNMQCKEKWF